MNRLIPARFAVKVGRGVLKLKKESPHIFFGLGLVGSAAGTVMACRATMKLPQTLDEIQRDITSLRDFHSEPSVTYSELDERKDVAHVYARSALKVVKLYGPSVLVSTASIGLLTGSHVQLNRRNAAAMAAYSAVAKALEDYRERVKAKLGEEDELEVYRGIQQVPAIGADGKRLELTVADGFTGSGYARCFDETSPNFTKDAEHNRYFVRCQETYANDQLKYKGYVFLNDVYEWLGFERTSEGQLVGWLLNGEGDNFVDFGLFETHNSRFMSGFERTCWLDFNVDGIIYDKI